MSGLFLLGSTISPAWHLTLTGLAPLAISRCDTDKRRPFVQLSKFELLTISINLSAQNLYIPNINYFQDWYLFGWRIDQWMAISTKKKGLQGDPKSGTDSRRFATPLSTKKYGGTWLHIIEWVQPKKNIVSRLVLTRYLSFLRLKTVKKAHQLIFYAQSFT
jgi:hypothetical protein